MTVHAGYDPIGNKCLGHAQPGTKNLAEAIVDRYGGRSDGIYNCRTQRGNTSLSAHGEGRAYDHHWIDRDSGFVIANRLVEQHAALGIQVVIWFDRIWSYTKGWHDYHGQDPHHTHLHIEQNWSGANDLTYAAAIAALTTKPEAPDVNERQNQIIENLEQRTSDIAGAIGDIQKTLGAVKPGGLTEADVRKIVREEIDKTRLAG